MAEAIYNTENIDTTMQALLKELESYGNEPALTQTIALSFPMRAFWKMAAGQWEGRYAYALPMGCGKTTAIVIFAQALNKLGLLGEVSLAVCASRVEALCELKRDMVAKGVDPEDIGLIHSYSHNLEKARAILEDTPDIDTDGYASEPSTADNDNRPIVLVTHNMVMSKDNTYLYGYYKGHERSLVVWDESFIKSTSSSIKGFLLPTGLRYCRDVMWSRFDAAGKEAVEYLQECVDILQKAKASAGEGEEPVVRLPVRTPEQLSDFKRSLKQAAGGQLWDVVKPLRGLLEVCQCDLRITPGLNNGPVGMIINYDILIPDELSRVVILDASHNIRKLGKLDKSVVSRHSHFPKDIVDYLNVLVRQIHIGSGRNSIHREFSSKNKAKLLVHELVDYIKGINEDKAVLIATFKPDYDKETREFINCRRVLESHLEAAGIDTKALLPCGKPRFCWMTHGNETSTSKFAYCEHVIFVGLLNLGTDILKGNILGQVDDINADIPHDTLTAVDASEIAYRLHQGIGRGPCRRIKNGKALAQEVLLVHSRQGYGVEDLVKGEMPGIRWEDYPCKYVVKTKGKSVVEVAAEQIVAYLSQLKKDTPEGETIKMSFMKLKKLCGLDDMPTTSWGRARELAMESLQWSWEVSGRSIKLMPTPL